MASDTTPPSPDSGTPSDSEARAWGFKEWSLVCEALGRGAQSLILRKGGIHEGKKGFWWQHDRFYLFPTHFHEQETHFPWAPDPGEKTFPAEPEGRHVVRWFAEVDFKCQISDWSVLEKLQPLHHWTEETVRERFDWSGEQSLSLAFVRVYRLGHSWSFPDQPSYGGCRSWVSLPDAPSMPHLPVLTDGEHEARRAVVRAVLGME